MMSRAAIGTIRIQSRPAPSAEEKRRGGAQHETKGGGSVNDKFDVSLEDSDLLEEVELTTSLIIAATESDAPLSAEEIDRLLGL